MPIKGRGEALSARHILFGSIVLLVMIRLISWFNTTIISRDSVIYVVLARDWLSGAYLKALSHPYHPLYSFLMAVVSKFSGISPEYSGVVISIMASALTLPALVIIFREYNDRRVYLLSLLFFCVSPFLVRYTADVLTEPLYFFFVLWAAALVVKASIPGEKPGWYLLAGMSVGFAYLTRPEGLVVGIAGVLWLLSTYRNRSPKRIVAGLLVLILGGIIIGSPYILYLHRDTGTWLLTRKKRIGTLVSEVSGKGNSVQRAHRPPKALKQLPKGISKKRAVFLRNRRKWQWEQADRIRQALGQPSKPRITPRSSLGRLILVFVISLGVVILGFFKGMFFPIGIWVVFRFFGLKRFPWNRIDRFILIFSLLYCVMLGLLLSGYGYVSRRHYAAVSLFWFGWAAVGFVFATEFIAKRIKQKFLTVKVVGACLLIPVLGISVIKGTKPFRREKMGRKVVGAWIMKQRPLGRKSLILTSMVRIGYYAGCQAIFLQTVGEKDINALRRHEIAYVVLQKEEMKRSPVLMALLQRFGYHEVFRYTSPVGHQDLHVFTFGS